MILLPLTLSKGIFDSVARADEALFAPHQFIVLTVSIFLTQNLYFILMHGVFGQTLGKMAAGVRVLNSSENKLSISQAAVREIPALISSATFLLFEIYFRVSNDSESASVQLLQIVFACLLCGWNVANIAALVINSKNRALHDFIAKTIVVKT